MSIHREHPFTPSEGERDQVRRLRGRLGGAVSLWTSGEGRRRAGLTVSSLMAATGEPGHLVALVDPDSDLAERLEETGTAVVALLEWPHRDLAEAFAGTAPAPGGPFAQATFEQTAWGPRLADAPTWAGVRLRSATELGWSLLVTAEVETVTIGAEQHPLLHRRGRYRQA